VTRSICTRTSACFWNKSCWKKQRLNGVGFSRSWKFQPALKKRSWFNYQLVRSNGLKNLQNAHVIGMKLLVNLSSMNRSIFFVFLAHFMLFIDSWISLLASFYMWSAFELPCLTSVQIRLNITEAVWKRVPYTFFVTREWAFLLCVKREWGFNFSVIRESIFYRPRKNGFRFFVIREICISLRVICEPTTFAGILFQLVNYTILDVHSAS